MLTMIGLSGSLRQGFFNSSLLRAAAKLVPEGVELRVATEECEAHRAPSDRSAHLAGYAEFVESTRRR